MPQAVRFCFELELEGVVSACDLEVKFSFGVLILVRSLTLTEAVETGHTGANLRAFGVCCPLFIFRKKYSFSAVKQHGAKRKYTAPILLYQNHCATFNIIQSGDIETNPGPNTCTICEKTVRKN